jgi:aldehyde dehydrogenase
MSATIEPTTTGTAGADDVVRHATLPEGSRQYAISIPIKARYDNWIGGKYARPPRGSTSATRRPSPGSTCATWPARRPRTWSGRSTPPTPPRPRGAAPSPAERANILNRIADRVEQNLEAIAVIETIDNGKPVRETVNADMALVVDHFRYFAGCIRAQEGGISELDDDTVAYHIHEPLGVVAQIIPWNFPLLMATWKLAPRSRPGTRW